MDNKTIHIFVVSNPISSIHASVLMQQFSRENSEFILILERGQRKASFNGEIINCAGKNWTNIIDLGQIISDESNLKPSLRKRITRKVKHAWPIKPIYNSLLKKYVKQYNEETTRKLTEKLNHIENNNSTVKLYLLTQTVINDALINLFPKASINFFEHGLPDYLFSFKKRDFSVENYYCLFNNEFTSFTQKHGMTGLAIKPLMTKEQYLSHCETIFKNSVVVNQLNEKIIDKSVLIIMQSLEKYELGNDFWINYLEKIAENEKTLVGKCTLLLKPHPHQSNEILYNLSDQLNKKRINHIILNEANEIGFSSEVLFSTFSNRFTAVYSPFSYSVYFLSHLFNDSTVRFYDSYITMKKYIGNAPKQYQEQFLAHEEIIKECFATKSKSFTF